MADGAFHHFEVEQCIMCPKMRLLEVRLCIAAAQIELMAAQFDARTAAEALAAAQEQVGDLTWHLEESHGRIAEREAHCKAAAAAQEAAEQRAADLEDQVSGLSLEKVSASVQNRHPAAYSSCLFRSFQLATMTATSRATVRLSSAPLRRQRRLTRARRRWRPSLRRTGGPAGSLRFCCRSRCSRRTNAPPSARPRGCDWCAAGVHLCREQTNPLSFSCQGASGCTNCFQHLPVCGAQKLAAARREAAAREAELEERAAVARRDAEAAAQLLDALRPKGDNVLATLWTEVCPLQLLTE